MRGTGSEETGEGVSDAAADMDATEEVEAAGRFRIYLGAAPGVGKTYAMLSEGQRPSPSRDGRSIDGLRALAADLGARWHEIDDDDPARALVSFAREHQITQIAIGSIQSSWWRIVAGGPILRRVIHEAGAFGIDVHVIAHRELPPAAAPESSAAKES